MILITKGGLSRDGDSEMPENCLYDCRLRDTCIYVPRWADEETLLRIGTERSKSCPLVQVYEVPKETEQAHTVMFDRKTENSSEKPNNCEHITEDGVTCAKYPACDDCLDNPLNKVKGSERLVKGKDEPTISKMEQVEDEPQTCDNCKWGEWYRKGYDITMMDDECGGCCSWNSKWTPKDESQTGRNE